MKKLITFLMTFALLLMSSGIKATVYLNEDFSGFSSSGVPTTWNRSDNDPSTMSTSYQWKGSTSGYQGNCAYCYMYGTSALKARLKSPSIALDQNKDAIMTFMLKGYTTDARCGVLNVYVSTDGGTTYTNNVVASNIQSATSWTEYSFSLSAYKGQNVNLVFEAVGSGSTTYRYLYLDNLVVKDAPTCQSPQDAYVSSLTGSTATLTWGVDSRFGNYPDNFNITLRDNSGAVVHSGTCTGTTTTYSFTGLTNNTTYTATVQSDCSQSSLGVSDSLNVQFTTLPAAINPPFFENFDSMTAFPSGYYVSGATINTSKTYAYGGAGKSAKLTTTTADGAYIVFPLINIAANTMEVDFYIRRMTASTVNNITFQAGYLTDPADIEGTFVPVLSDSLPKTATWANKRFNTTALTDQTSPVMLCIYVGSGFSTSVYVDNVDIHTASVCLRPENLTVTDYTSTTATLDWSMTNATNVRISALNMTDSTVITALASQHPYTMTGLEPQTTYEFTARGICSATDSSELSTPATVTMRCATAASTTFIEDAEETTGSDLPDCWEAGHIQQVATTSQPFYTQTTTKQGSRGFALRQMSSGNIAYLCSQQLNFDQSGKYSFRYKFYRPSGTTATYSGEGLKVFVTPAMGDTTNAVRVIPFVNRLAGFSPVGSTGWNEYEGVINYQGLGYIMIVGYSKGGTAAYFDDLEVFNTPSCAKPSSVSLTNTTSNSADITWVAADSVADWILHYQLKQGTAVIRDTTLMVSGLPQATFSGLAPATTYNISADVRTYCGVGDTSEVVEMPAQNFTTQCAALSTFPYTMGFEDNETYVAYSTYRHPSCWTHYNDYTTSTTSAAHYYPYTSSTYKHEGSKALYYYASKTSTSYPSIAMFALPEIDTTAYSVNELRVKYWTRESSTSYSQTLYIGAMTNPSDPTTFTKIDSVLVSGTTFVENVSNLSNYTGNGTYIAFAWYQSAIISSYSGVYLDDVTVDPIPSCADLAGSLTMTAATDSSVSFTIDDLTATNWQYAFDLTGTPVSQMTPVSHTGSSLTLTGLDEATSYDIYVRRDCGNNDFGAWTKAVTFSTTAVPATMPYVCGFENADENSKWMFVQGASTLNKFAIGTATDAVYSGSSALYLSNDSGTTYNYTMTTGNATRTYAYRTIHFDAQGYQVEFKWKCTGGEGSTTIYDYGRVMLLPTSVAIPAGQTNTSITSANPTAGFPSEAIFLDPEGKNGMYKVTTPEWNQVSQFVNMVNTPGDYNLVVSWTNDASSGAQSPLSIDDISITALTCIPPVSIIANTSSTSATLSWQQSGETEWEVVVDTAAFTKDSVPTTAIYRVDTTATSVTLNGLTPNTEYYVSIRTICGANDTSAWLEPTTFRTFCSAYPVPHTETFDVAGSENCWTIVAGQTTGASISRVTTQHHSGTASLQSVKATVVSPEYSVDSLTHYMINGWAYSATDSVTFSVGVMVDPNDASTYETFSDVLIPKKNTWTEFTAYFTDLADPDYVDYKTAKHIVMAVSGDNTIYFDDLMVDLTPTCPKPTEVLVSNITAHSFDISFVNNSSATQFAVTVDGAQHIINTNPATISGLDAATNYDVKIAAICSSTDTSYYTTVGTVRTLCDRINLPWSTGFEASEGYTGGTSYNAETTANFAANCWDVLNNKPGGSTYPYAYVSTTSTYVHTGTQGVYTYHSSSGAKDKLYMILPEFVEPSNALRIKLWYKNYSTSTTYSQLKVGYMTDATVDTTFVSISDLDRYTTWTEAEVTTNSTVPANARIALCIDRTGTYGYGLYIDDIEVTQIRNCSDPETPVVSDITASTATVTFTDTCAAHNSWFYVYGVAGFNPNTATPAAVDTSRTFSLSGLSDDTDYDVYVRAVCGAGDSSNYIKASFRTLCVPFHVTSAHTFSDDFNSYNYGAYLHTGTCFDILNEPTSTSYWAKAYPASISTSTTYKYCYGHAADNTDRCLYWYLYKTQMPDGGSIVRQFHLDADSTYEFAGWVRNSTSTSYSMKVSMLKGTSTDALDTLTSKIIDGATVSSVSVEGVSWYYYNTLYQQMKAVFTVDSTGDYYLGFHAGFNPANTYSYNYLYLDDWTVRPFTGCKPAVATVDSTTQNSALCHHNDTTAGYAYEYYVMNGNDTAVGITSGNTQNFTISGLPCSSTLTLYIRHICGVGDYSEWTSTDIVTQCGPVSSFPYTEGFEGSFPPQCWSKFYYGTTTAYNWTTSTSTTYVHSGSKAAYISYSSSKGRAALVTGELNLTNPYGYYVRFWSYRAAATSYPDIADALHVGYLNQPITDANIANVNEIGVIHRNCSLTPVESATGKYEYEFEIPAGVTGSVWISFDYHSEGSYTYYAIDDITIEPIPSCATPRQAPTVQSTTMTTATLSVDMKGKPVAQVSYALGAAPGDTLGSVLTTDGVAIIPGLTGATNYSFRYRFICGANDTSAWSPAVVGSTTATDCFEPQNLHIVGSVLDTAAAFAWGKAPDVYSYEYELYIGNNASGTRVDSSRTSGDTVAYANLATNTNYFFRVRGFCQTDSTNDTTNWRSISFQTLRKTYATPFVCDFEDATMNLNWQFRHLSTTGANDFVIGSGTQKGGTNSMYVSDDGSSYQYSATTTNVADAELLINLPAGNYFYSYDWNCNGYRSTATTATPYSYGRVFLVPQSTTVAATSYSTYNKTLPGNAISLDGSTALQINTNWPQQADAFTVTNGGVYKLVVLWANYSTVYNPPFAIDNISITPLSCMPVDAVSMISLNSNYAAAVVTPYDSAAVEYGLSLYDNVDSVITWSVATDDTLRMTSLLPGVDYTLFVRHACSATDKSPARKVSFTTPNNALTLPYVTSFEATDSTLSSWTTTIGSSPNYFIIANGTSSHGSQSLYVTNDGLAHQYQIAAVDGVAATSWSYAYVPIEFPAGSFNISFDWTCYGESTYDYGRVFLAPTTMVPQDNIQLTGLAYNSLPANTISLDGNTKLNLDSAWKECSAEVEIENANTYNFIVAWHNDASGGKQPPFAFDNLKIKQLTCPKLKVSDITLDSVSTDHFRIKVLGNNPGASIIYHVASSSEFSDTVAYGVTAVGDTLITVDSLSASTWYYARLWSLCGVGDTSSVVTISARTNCGVNSSFPYIEDFEGYQTGSTHKTELTDNCWITAASSTTPYHYITTTASYVHGGTNALDIYNSSTSGAYQTFGMPKVDTLAGKTLSMWYKNYSTTLSTSLAQLQVGYLSNPDNASSFVLLATAPINTTYSEFVYTYPSTIPAGVRPAFKANGTYYLYVDDIHLNNIVNGDEFYDVICYQGSYNLHGFDCPATTLLPGDTTLTRVVQSFAAGVPDSLIQAHVHVLPSLSTATYDTVCAGTPYVRGEWNIQTPQTQTYQHQHTSALGCDSTTYLHLYVYPSAETTYDTICQGDVYTFGTQSLTQTGVYVDTITNPRGCSVVTTLHLLVVDSAEVENATICQGESYTFEGGTYSQPGTYRVTKTGAHGCPLTKTLNLSVIPTDSTMTVSFCKGGSVQVIDTLISTPGNYTITRVSIQGCDITYHITATEDPVREGYVSDNACEGNSYSGYGVQGVIITQDTVILVNTKTIDGQCDSVGHVSLTFIATSYGEDSVWIKQGESYTWHNQTYNTAGDYKDTIQSSLGCDSICTLHLFVSGTAVDNVNEVIVNIVPNPVNAGETAYVTGDFSSDVTVVEILNNFGQVVDSFVPKTYPIEVQGITAAGLYYVRITTRDGAVHLQKLIVK